jgi:S1-C subfamily serine protease
MEQQVSPLMTIEVIGEPDAPATSDDSAPFWHRRRVRSGLAVLVVVVLLAAVALWRSSESGPAPITRADVNKAVQSGIARQQQQERDTPPDAATAYRRIIPSLVTVVDSKAAAKAGSGTAREDELGAGVVINAQGDILTALHVVAGGGQIQVRFADGTQAVAKVLNRQPASDIAVLGVDRLPSVVVPAVMGGGIQVGDAVFPVGNPLGLQGTLTAGVVSALNRRIRAQGGPTLNGLIQFDAAVNPGNSGGPLLDRDGHVVGIVTGLANPSQQSFFVGIGFAVPIATAGAVAGGPSK